MKNIFPGNKKKITTRQSIKTDDGETVIDQPTIAQRFNEFFTGAVSRLLDTAGPSANVRQFSSRKFTVKEMLYEVRYLKSTEDMILALAGQFKQLSHEPEKFR